MKIEFRPNQVEIPSSFGNFLELFPPPRTNFPLAEQQAVCELFDHEDSLFAQLKTGEELPRNKHQELTDQLEAVDNNIGRAMLKVLLSGIFEDVLSPKEKIILALRQRTFKINEQSETGEYILADGYYKKILDWAIQTGKLPSSIWEKYKTKGYLTQVEIARILEIKPKKVQQIGLKISSKQHRFRWYGPGGYLKYFFQGCTREELGNMGLGILWLPHYIEEEFHHPHKIYIMGKLLEMTDDEFLKIYGVGPATLELIKGKIRILLERLGLNKS